MHIRFEHVVKHYRGQVHDTSACEHPACCPVVQQWRYCGFSGGTPWVSMLKHPVETSLYAPAAPISPALGQHQRKLPGHIIVPQHLASSVAAPSLC